MGSPITRADIDRWRLYLKNHYPYSPNDPVLKQYDEPYNTERQKATTAFNLLTSLDIDPYDDNDYGNITD